METNLATPVVLLSFEAKGAPVPQSRPMLAAAFEPPSTMEKAAAIVLLFATAAPAAVLGWVAWLTG